MTPSIDADGPRKDSQGKGSAQPDKCGAGSASKATCSESKVERPVHTNPQESTDTKTRQYKEPSSEVKVSRGCNNELERKVETSPTSSRKDDRSSSTRGTQPTAARSSTRREGVSVDTSTTKSDAGESALQQASGAPPMRPGHTHSRYSVSEITVREVQDPCNASLLTLDDSILCLDDLLLLCEVALAESGGMGDPQAAGRLQLGERSGAQRNHLANQGWQYQGRRKGNSRQVPQERQLLDRETLEPLPEPRIDRLVDSRGIKFTDVRQLRDRPGCECFALRRGQKWSTSPVSPPIVTAANDADSTPLASAVPTATSNSPGSYSNQHEAMEHGPGCTVEHGGQLTREVGDSHKGAEIVPAGAPQPDEEAARPLPTATEAVTPLPIDKLTATNKPRARKPRRSESKRMEQHEQKQNGKPSQERVLVGREAFRMQYGKDCLPKGKKPITGVSSWRFTATIGMSFLAIVFLLYAGIRVATNPGTMQPGHKLDASQVMQTTQGKHSSRDSPPSSLQDVYVYNSEGSKEYGGQAVQKGVYDMDRTASST
eukprot:scaffold603_cov404-Prasinococcus_capsulatus_cf.AAC.58